MSAKNLSYYSENKEQAHYGAKVMFRLLETLMRHAKPTGRYVVVLETDKHLFDGVRVDGFADAIFLKKKLNKIGRLAFRDDFKVNILEINT